MSESNEFMAAGPLQITYWLTPSVTVVTSVFGDARNATTVGIYNGSMLVWTGSMNQVSPKAIVETDLNLGSFYMKAGTTFTMTIPTQQQPGSMFMQATVQTPPNPPTPFNAVVATWPLTS